MDATQQSTPHSEPQVTYLDVTFIPGVTVYGSGPARLSWANDRLTLTKVTGTKQEPVYTEVFNVGAGEIEKVSIMVDEVRVFVNGKRYRMSVAQYSTPLIGAGGVAGVAVAAGMYKKSGASHLIEWLTQKGIRVTRFGYGALIGVAVGVAVLAIAIIAIIAAIKTAG